MASGGPDLFVICKHCGAEVSPYITECPYCGNRIQKRAPKLDRDGRIAEKRRHRPPSPTLPRLRRGEIPGIRHDSHPYGTALVVLLSFAGTLLWRTGLVNLSQLVAFGSLQPHYWRVFTAPFVYENTGYAVITIGVIALFGTLWERRHGTLLMAVVFLLGAAAGTAVGLQVSHSLIDGANGAALALCAAWAVPDLRAALAREDYDGDLTGAGVLALVVALMPLVAPEASWVADGVGLAAGIVVGFPVSRLHPV
ncbi:zinc ribbon domain-containing protein [Conexibacter sp. DBS9H8]|uniref:zinc ribbon domain-containing protein n=1 Tax=Conexibacter sp. DBS9H8 TaxID=2937801 RepID=UPI00200BFAF2|nr:zinc ribbon domain-containing protein [Conexibacter sp. DBS9H8]